MKSKKIKFTDSSRNSHIIDILEILSSKENNPKIKEHLDILKAITTVKIVDLPALDISSDTDIFEVSKNGAGSFKQARLQMIAYFQEKSSGASQQKTVASNGTNTIASGGILNPYLSLDYAISQITDSAFPIVKPYVINVFTNITIADLIIKPNVFINMNGYSLTVTNSVTLDASWSNSGIGIIKNSNTVSFPSTVTLDFGLVGADFAALDISYFRLLSSTSTITVKANPTGTTILLASDMFGTSSQWNWNVYNCYGGLSSGAIGNINVYKDVDTTGGNFNIQNLSTLGSVLVENSSTTDLLLNHNICLNNADVTYRVTNAGNMTVLPTGTRYPVNNPIIDKGISTGIVNFSPDFITTTPTLLNGATFTPTTIADGVNANFPMPGSYFPENESVKGHFQGIAGAMIPGTLKIENADYTFVAPISRTIFWLLDDAKEIILPDPSDPENNIVDGSTITVLNSPFSNVNGANGTVKSFLNNTVVTINSGQAFTFLYTTSGFSVVDNWLPIQIATDKIPDLTQVYTASNTPLKLELDGGKPFSVIRNDISCVASFAESETRIYDDVYINKASNTSKDTVLTASGIQTSITQDIRGILFFVTEPVVLKSLGYFDSNFPAGSRDVGIFYANSGALLTQTIVDKADPLDTTGLFRTHTLTDAPVLFPGQLYALLALIPPGEAFTNQPSLFDARITTVSGIYQEDETVLMYPNASSSDTFNSCYGNVSFSISALNVSGMHAYTGTKDITVNESINNDYIGSVCVNTGANRTLTLPLNDSLSSDAEFDVLQASAATLIISASAGVTLNGVVANAISVPQYERANIKKISSNNWILSGADVPIELITSAYAEMFFQDNATVTPLTTANTPLKVSATYTSGVLQNFSHSAGTLTYIDSNPRDLIVTASLTATYDGTSQDTSFYIAKNGAVVTKSKQKTFIGTTTPANQTCVVSAIIPVVSGDILELWVENNINGNDILVSDLNFSAISANAFLEGSVNIDGEDYLSLVGDTITAEQINLNSSNVINRLPFSKVNAIATNKLAGRSTSGTGNLEEIGVGSGLTLAAGVLSAVSGAVIQPFSFVFAPSFSSNIVASPPPNLVFGTSKIDGDYITGIVNIVFEPTALTCDLAFEAPLVAPGAFPIAIQVGISGNVSRDDATQHGDLGYAGNFPANLAGTNVIYLPISVPTISVYYYVMFSYVYKYQNF